MSDNINTTVALDKARTDSDTIAPVWQTAVVILVLLGLVALSIHVRHEGGVQLMPHRMNAYLVVIIAEWLVVAFIGLCTHWRGASLLTLVGENSPCWQLVARDLGLAVVFLVVANILVFLLSHVVSRLMHPDTNDAMKSLLPQSGVEAVAFLLLALTAGICEEIIFRGYLQRQFTAWTNSLAVGIAVQGIAFGLAHAYQGSTQVILIGVYGSFFGLLAKWRGSLRPGMLAHFIQDGIGGLLLARFC